MHHEISNILKLPKMGVSGRRENPLQGRDCFSIPRVHRELSITGFSLSLKSPDREIEFPIAVVLELDDISGAFHTKPFCDSTVNTVSS